MKISEIFIIEKIDNERGAGATPNNSNIDYMGLRVMMRPSVFLSLAKRLSSPSRTSLEFIEHAISSGRGIGSPMLMIDTENTEEDPNVPAKVTGHEGRHRCMVWQKLYGDKPMEIHIKPRGETRARHLTPEIIKSMQWQLYNENGRLIIPSTKFFEVKR